MKNHKNRTKREFTRELISSVKLCVFGVWEANVSRQFHLESPTGAHPSGLCQRKWLWMISLIREKSYPEHPRFLYLILSAPRRWKSSFFSGRLPIIDFCVLYVSAFLHQGGWVSSVRKSPSRRGEWCREFRSPTLNSIHGVRVQIEAQPREKCIEIFLWLDFSGERKGGAFMYTFFYSSRFTIIPGMMVPRGMYFICFVWFFSTIFIVK